MVDLSFIKKRKAKKIIAISGGVCGAAMIVIGAAALIGQQAAPLTVTLTNSGASLALYKSEYDNKHKSYLLAGDPLPYAETTEPNIREHESVIDIDDSVSLKTSDEKSIEYYQYTFYITNTGDTAADYSLSLNISYPHKSSFDLADVLRVRFYENDGNDKSAHKYRTFAKHSKDYDTKKKEYIPERIAGSGTDYAEPFESSSKVLTREVKAFAPKAVTRYTFVAWIEGEDEEAKGKKPDSSIALGVDISAHEAEATSKK